MMYLNKSLVLLFIFAFAGWAFASGNNDANDIDIEALKNTALERKKPCSRAELPGDQDKIFKSLAMASSKHSPEFCRDFKDDSLITDATSEKIARDLITELNALPRDVGKLGFPPNVIDHAIVLVKTMSYSGFESRIHTYSCQEDGMKVELKLRTSGYGDGCGDITFTPQQEKSVKRMIDALSMYYLSYLKDFDKKYLIYLNQLTTEWERYVKKSKPQTSLEMIVQFGLFGGKNGGYFKKPPSWQLLFLRPTPVYEYTWDADKGNRDDVSLAFEVIGAHAWDGIGWLPPVGLSAGILYTDREGVESDSPTVMLHMGNKYSIGYAKRDTKDGGDSVYVTFDLLNFFVDKEKRLAKIKSKL